MRWQALVMVIALAGNAMAETRMIRPSYARPEDIEAVVSKVVPKAGVAAVKAQGSVLISGDDDVLEEVARVIREMDQPGQVVELEVAIAGASANVERVRGAGASVTRARASSPPRTPPTELRTTRGASASSSVQSLIAMAGRPAEVVIGEGVLVDGGPLAPPREIQTGKRIAIDGLRVIDDGKGAEMDVAVEDTAPGAGAVVSSGTRAKTSVRLLVGQTQYISTIDESTDAAAGESGASGTARDGGSARAKRVRTSASRAGQVAITLKAIR